MQLVSDTEVFVILLKVWFGFFRYSQALNTIYTSGHYQSDVGLFIFYLTEHLQINKMLH